jgi:thiamine-phosphate pyrophosphorylase|tara:strand:+ start:37 stop:582 length:546 start_codon:yes stop_codon:yes gene_type:complete
MHIKFFKKYYFIEKFNKSNIDKQAKNTTIIYRNYKKKLIEDEIINIKKYCRKKNLQFFLSNNVRLSLRLNLDGAYIPSFNNEFSHLSYVTRKGFILVGSAHNLKEVRIKEKQKVSRIFISSLFKDNKNYLGLNRFKLISNLSKIQVIALGGISKSNQKLIMLTKSVGFAGISYFENQKKGL